MNRLLRSIAVVALASSAAFSAFGAATERCNALRSESLIITVRDRQAQDVLAAAARNAASRPDLYRRLWSPAALTHVGIFGDWLAVAYPETEDIEQIWREVDNDPVLREVGLVSVGINGYGGFPVPPPTRDIVEFFNIFTGHYFLSSSAQETRSIEEGAAGAGWQRTGDSFRAVDFDGYHFTDILRVNRLYAPGANSHFYTVDAAECGAIRKVGMGWLLEGTAFWGYMPVNGACPRSGTTPLYRAYNNRWMFNDYNHRFNIRPEIYRQMIDAGWIGEGVAVCVQTHAGAGF